MPSFDVVLTRIGFRQLRETKPFFGSSQMQGFAAVAALDRAAGLLVVFATERRWSVR